MLPHLVQHVPEKYGRYIEPFAGSACLFFDLSPERAILSDLNSELMAMYKVLRRNPLKLWALTAAMPVRKGFYYAIRKMQTSSLDPISSAARFIYLNRNCFNGLYRTNKKGEFNVPRGNRTGELPGPDRFRAVAKMLRKADLRCCDFELTLQLARRSDFVYMDPPYASVMRKDRNEYGVGSFSPAEVPRLLSALKQLDEKGVFFLLSYSQAPDFIQQIPRATLRRHRVRRSIASSVDLRKKAPEVLLTNRDLFP